MTEFKCSTSRGGSPLEQLIEEINFQRAKEMRQLLKDESGFVMLHDTTYWTDLFVKHFLFEDDRSAQESDDLIFFIRKRCCKEAAKYSSRSETLLEVFRRDSKKLPIGDAEIDWEESIYTNLIIHHFDYYLTLAVCARPGVKELQVLRRHTERVWASPSRRRMSDKGTSEEITYPNICFTLDNFDEAFTDIVVREGEMISVELVAQDRAGTLHSVIFLGSVRYDCLRRVYDSRTSLGSKVASRMTFGLFSSPESQRMEFVRVKGPMGKGHAELAVTKPHGSDGGTPTPEHGLSPSEETWEAEMEEMQRQRRQRRSSDPWGSVPPGPEKNVLPRQPKPDVSAPTPDAGVGAAQQCAEEIAARRPRLERESRLSEGPSHADSFIAEEADVRTCATVDDTSEQTLPKGKDAPQRQSPNQGSNFVGNQDTENISKDSQDLPGTVPGEDDDTLRHKPTRSSTTEELSRPAARPAPAAAPAPTAAGAARLARGTGSLPRSVGRRAAGTTLTPGMLYRQWYGQPERPDRCDCARTADGTVVHYRCHVQRLYLRQREMDEGVCNPLWSMRGLSQSLQLWRDTRRGASLPLGAYVTYVMLPWHAIINDLINKDNRQDAILSF